jgi:NDP-sugar pyrophosphorylase family protein
MFEILVIMNKFLVSQIPILDGGNLLGVYVKEVIDYSLASECEMVIMAGGKGSRLHDLTVTKPKPMIDINGTPMLELLLIRAIEAKFQNFYLSVNYLKNQIKDYFGNGKNFGINIEYLEEIEPLGTAGSLSLLPKNLKKILVLINADVLTRINYEDLLLFHKKNSAEITIGVREDIVDIPYGVLTLDGILVKSIQEKPSIKNFISSGIYVINTDVLDRVLFDGYLDMPDFLLKCLNLDVKVVAFPIHEYWIDIGRKETLIQANNEWLADE